MKRAAAALLLASATSLAVACGGRDSGGELTDASGDDGSVDASLDGATTDASDAADAPATVELDAASCASRAIAAACSDGGAESLLWTAIEKCGPKECSHVIHVTLDNEGCPTSVRVNGLDDFRTYPELALCVASALSTERWWCGDAQAVTYQLAFGGCTN